MRQFALDCRKKFGNDRMYWKQQEEANLEEFDESNTYTSKELDAFADAFLKEDSKKELCRKCDNYGEETGHVECKPEFDEEGNLQVDEEGNQLYVNYPEFKCLKGHRWYKGEGKARGTKGDNPILFQSQIDNRKRREILTDSGTPDPHVVSGLYNRTHEKGRKVNSPDQRRRHGASFYR